MFASRAAPFLRQKDSFSCRDAHAFNRNSSSQVTVCVAASRFSTCFTRIFSGVFSSYSLFSRIAVARTLSIRCRQFPGASPLEVCLTRQTAEHLTAQQG